MDIVLNNISKAFGNEAVFCDFSAVFPMGQTTCLMAPSGFGKTTLLRLLMGLEKTDGGVILGVPEKISAVFQENRLCDGLCAVDNIRLVTDKDVSISDISKLLSELGLDEAENKPVRDYSGGMRRRVALARALLADWDLLLLDEPFTGLDEDSRALVAAVLRRRASGKTVILVTHDPAEAELLGAEVLRIAERGLKNHAEK